MSFIKYVDSFSSRNCGDDLDRLYGLFGLQTDGDQEFRAEYGDSVETAYLNFAFKYLNQQENLCLLHFAARWHNSSNEFIGFSQQRQEPPNLLSWIPDWRNHCQEHILGVDANFYSASKLAPNFLVDRNNLPFIGISGVRIEAVTTDHSTILLRTERLEHLGYLRNSKPWELIKIRNRFLEILSTAVYPTGEVAEEAFAKTLMLDARPFQVRSMFSKSNESLLQLWFEVEQKYKNHVGLDSIDCIPRDETQYERASKIIGIWKKFFITNSGYIGIGPFVIEPGDVVVVLDGNNTPFVIRQVPPESPNVSVSGTSEQWQLVGECYLHGFMDNEVTTPEYRKWKEMF